MLLYINTCKCLTVLLLLMKHPSLLYGQVIYDGEEVTSMPVDIKEESFLKTVEFRVRSRMNLIVLNILYFQAILGGVVGFWGGVFSMGSIYILMVFAKRIINPAPADDSD